MEAEDGVHPDRPQEGDGGKGAEGAVGEGDVAGAEDAPEDTPEEGVVLAPGALGPGKEGAAGEGEEGDDLDDGESAAFLLARRLGERLLPIFYSCILQPTAYQLDRRFRCRRGTMKSAPCDTQEPLCYFAQGGRQRHAYSAQHMPHWILAFITPNKPLS